MSKQLQLVSFTLRSRTSLELFFFVVVFTASQLFYWFVFLPLPLRYNLSLSLLLIVFLLLRFFVYIVSLNCLVVAAAATSTKFQFDSALRRAASISSIKWMKFQKGRLHLCVGSTSNIAGRVYASLSLRSLRCCSLFVLQVVHSMDLPQSWAQAHATFPKTCERLPIAAAVARCTICINHSDIFVIKHLFVCLSLCLSHSLHVCVHCELCQIFARCTLSRARLENSVSNEHK